MARVGKAAASGQGDALLTRVTARHPTTGEDTMARLQTLHLNVQVFSSAFEPVPCSLTHHSEIGEALYRD